MEPHLLDFREVQNSGRDLDRRQPEIYEGNVERTRADDLAFICYTSGTTGSPKGAMLTFRNLLGMAVNLMEVDGKFEKDEFVSFLPLAWIGEQMMCLSSALLTGFAVNFPEKPETVQENIREVGPTVMFSPPRIWENMTSTVQVKIMDASAPKRWMYHWALPVGYEYADAVFRKAPIPLSLKIRQKLAYHLVFRALKDRLGLLRLRSASTGGAALGPDVFKFFTAMGVNLKQIYGQTEISGISCIHREGDVDFDSVGQPIPETEIRISGTGEILSRSPAVFLGYYKNEEETAKTLADGWLHSGDAGYFNEAGHLVVIDRVKDVMHLNDGTRFSPQFIENKLKFSPYIKECVCLGDRRDFLAAMVCIDYPNVGKWAEGKRVSYTTYTDLAGKPEVVELLAGEVEKVNATLPETTRIRRFVLLYKELDADDDELTRTRKVRRGFVGERYAHVIGGMYAGDPEIPVDAVIKYQDGKTSRIRTTLPVRELRGGR
jgi:long-chain acyl-CoA synthetase